MRKKAHVIKSVEIRHVKLTKASRKSLRKVKEPLWGDVAYAIESVTWLIPSETYEYLDLMQNLESGIRDFYEGIPDDAVIEVESFDSNILSFEKGHSREDLAK